MKKNIYFLSLFFIVFFGLLRAGDSLPPKEIKTLVLIITSDGTQAYIELQKIWKAYMNLDPDHFEVYFIRGDPSVSSHEIRGNDLIVKAEESYKPGIMNKTVLSIEALLPRLNEFDFVLRTNLSSFYVFPRLLDFLKTLPKTNCYCGVRLHLPAQCGTTKGSIHFISGAGIIMSTDLAKMMVDQKEVLFQLSPQLPDDVLIGLFFQDKQIPLLSANRVDFPNRLAWYQNKNAIDSKAFHFRAKSNYTERSAAEDYYDELFIDRQLLKKFYSISKENINDQDKKILLGAVIKNNEAMIPDFLDSLNYLDYDKKLIHLQISNCNDSSSIKKMVENWVEKNKARYAQITYTDKPFPIDQNRNKYFGEVKNEFLSQTKIQKCDYCFIVESDVFLSPTALAYLVEKNKPIISPLLKPLPNTNANYRNFYVDTTENGYYKDHPDYFPITYNRKIGVFKVGCVSSVYLIQAESLDKLTFEDGRNDWEALSFCRSANKNHVDQYVCNEMEFGYFLHHEKPLSITEEREYCFLDSHLNFYDYLFDPKRVDDNSILKDVNESLVFVILAHARSEKDNLLWRRCYDSIRLFYPDAKVVIIDDNSLFALSDDSLTNTTFIQSEYPGAGELLPYYYFLKNRWADKMIFLHDSMFLKRPFTSDELIDSVKFHWYFKDHSWDEQSVIISFLNYLPDAEELIRLNCAQERWYGCFGVAGIINLKVLEELEKKYYFIEKLIPLINKREQRMALERVFAILIFKEGYTNLEKCSNFGCIHDYPLSYHHLDENSIEALKNKYQGAIIKTWQGR